MSIDQARPRSAIRRATDRRWAMLFRHFLLPGQRMRRQQFETLPLPSGAIVLFGDSITEGGLWNEWFPHLPVINRGIGGERVPDLIDRVDSAVADPTAVFLLIGTNDLAFGAYPEQIASEIHTLIGAIRGRAPGATIFLQSVMPRQMQFAAELLDLNERLRVIAKQYEVEYVDLWHAFVATDGSLRAEFSLDGLHLNGAGYAVWVEMLRPLVKRFTPQV